MDKFHNTVGSPIVDYGYPLMIVFGFIFLVWVSFTKSGKAMRQELIGDVATVVIMLSCLWVLFLWVVGSFFGIVKWILT